MALGTAIENGIDASCVRLNMLTVIKQCCWTVKGLYLMTVAMLTITLKIKMENYALDRVSCKAK